VLVSVPMSGLAILTGTGYDNASMWYGVRTGRFAGASIGGALALELVQLQFLLLVVADEAAKSLAGVRDDDVPP
jgi:hypothetical protein